jgi:hypothetical protein
MNWTDKISKWLRSIWKRTSQQETSEQLIQKLMDMLQRTRSDEISCDYVYAFLDQYTEMVSRGEDAAHLMPLIKHHLDMCQDCQEEYTVLLQILEASPS